MLSRGMPSAQIRVSWLMIETLRTANPDLQSGLTICETVDLFKYICSMSDQYKIQENDKAYFLTITTVGWVDIFTRKNHKMAIVDALDYC